MRRRCADGRVPNAVAARAAVAVAVGAVVVREYEEAAAADMNSCSRRKPSGRVPARGKQHRRASKSRGLALQARSCVRPSAGRRLQRQSLAVVVAGGGDEAADADVERRAARLDQRRRWAGTTRQRGPRVLLPGRAMWTGWTRLGLLVLARPALWAIRRAGAMRARVYAIVNGGHDDEVDEAVVKERPYGVSIKARWKRWPKRERRKRKEWRKG